MARLTGPNQAERVFYYTSGLRKGQVMPNGTPVPLYSDNQCSLPADVLSLTGGALAVDGEIPQVLIGDTLEAPRFQFPDVSDPVVYTRILGGPVLALHPDPDSRLDAFQGVLTTVTADVSGATTGLAELPSTYAGLGGNIQATVRKLADTGSTDDVKVLILGDSTAAAGMWPDYLLASVQALYPHKGLKRYGWNSTNNTYDAAATVATGTNTTTPTWIHQYNGGQGGTVPESTYATFDARCAAVQPDVVLINYGHNYGYSYTQSGFASDAVQRQVTRERFLRFAAEVKRACPTADVVIASQNPWLDDSLVMQAGINELRAQIWREIAADMGAAYAPILETYQAQANPLTYLGADKLHPNTAGSQLGAGAVLPLFRYLRNLPPSGRVVSPLLLPGANLLTNGNFSSFASPPTLPGWSVTNGSVLSKNTTQFESGNGYSVRLQAGAGSGIASMYASLPNGRVKGQVITVAARVYLPTAGATSSSGRLQLTGSSITTLASGTLSLARDQWIWVWVTARIPAASTFVTVSILSGSAGTTDECSVDRVVAVLGHLPRDTA